MKAVVYTEYGPPDVLQLQEVEVPAPKDKEVLVRVRATAVTFGECKARDFHLSPQRVLASSPALAPGALGLWVEQAKEEHSG